MRTKIVAGNWKMNGRKQQLSDLARALKAGLPPLAENKRCIVFPPIIYLDWIAEILADSSIAVGAQNVYPAEAGAYTGEVSTAMLSDLHCAYVLVGHSERRLIFNEDEKIIAKKFHHVKEHGMIPLLCLGETLEAREKGQTEAVIAHQLRSVCRDKESFKNSIIAYEPVWAIGTGKNAAPAQAQEVHEFIRAELKALTNEQTAQEISVLYGGSVNEQNAAALFAMPDIDGGLVGGASLDADKFLEIVKCIN